MRAGCDNGQMSTRWMKRALVAGAAVLGLETAYALLRPAPELESHDPSGWFGDPSLPRLRVAVLGDSSVNAPGVGGPGDIWVSRVCERVAEHYHVELRSFAVGGSMAHDLIREQLQPALESKPELVFVSVGANDAIKGVRLRVFEKNLDHLVGLLTDAGAIVVQSGVGDLGSIPRLYPPLRNLMSRRALRFDRAHWRVAARYGTTVVDQRSDDLEVWYENRELWADDLFHVSAHGHARWAETAWRSISHVVERLREPA